jgi:hypothetical protein
MLVNREGTREGLGKMGRTESWGAEIARATSMVRGRVARILMLRGASQNYIDTTVSRTKYHMLKK